MTVTRYIGFDISARSTGYAIVDRVHGEGKFIPPNDGQLFLRDVGFIPIPPSYRHQGQTVKYTDGERLHNLRVAIWELLDAYQPDIFIKEGLALNFGRFRASEIVSKATGVVEEAIASDFYKEKHQVIYEYKPSTIKKEVAGHGKAIKEDVQEAVFLYFDKAHFPKKVKRDRTVEYNDDATDAAGAILTHFIKNKIPFWTELSEDTKL